MKGSDKKRQYRLITRSDFDGLVCAVLLRDIDIIRDIQFVHPKDMQDGIVKITASDITTNLPYVEGVYLAFDHHYSETMRVGKRKNHIIIPQAKSAARVVYDYYGGEATFSNFVDMIDAVDKGDSADFTMEEIFNPTQWNMLNFIMDARTGLGRFQTFRISNYQLMMNLIDYCREHPIDEILAIPDVAERIKMYREHQELFAQQVKDNASIHKNVLVVDMRYLDTIYSGNRFLKYALFPNINVSIQVVWGLKRQNTVFTVGKSIFNHSLSMNIGELMLQYGGGGHANAGTCQVPNEDADEKLIQVIDCLKETS